MAEHESLVVFDSSVPDLDFLVKTVNKSVAQILIMAGGHRVSGIIERIKKSNRASVVWVYGDESKMYDISAVLNLAEFHFINLGKTSKLNPEWLLLSNVTESSNLFGMKHHLIRDEPAYEKTQYFNELIDFYPLIQADESFIANLCEIFELLDNTCRISTGDGPVVNVLNHNVINHYVVASRMICSVLMKYQLVKHETYNQGIVDALGVCFQNMRVLLARSDPNFRQTLDDMIAAKIEDGKVYLIVAILAINYGIDPATILSYCDRYNIESGPIFMGYLRSGQVVFDVDALSGAPITDHCLPAIKKTVARSILDRTRVLVLSPRTKLTIYNNPQFQGRMTVFENDSFTDDKEVVAKKWCFEFESYEISVLDRTDASQSS